jgi:hypothetical protein
MMQQTHHNRGGLAFIADQVRAAEQAFIAGEMKDCEEILRSLPPFIAQFLNDASKNGK